MTGPRNREPLSKLETAARFMSDEQLAAAIDRTRGNPKNHGSVARRLRLSELILLDTLERERLRRDRPT